MEVSSALQRCLRTVSIRPSSTKQFTSCTKLISKSVRQQTTRSPSRSFTSTSQTQQEASPQSQPASQEKSTAETISPRPSRSSFSSRPQPDPNNRIDLSSLPGIPSSYVPPPQNTPPKQQQQPGSASAKLDALFNRPPRSSENRFEKTIRQTDATNSSSPSLSLPSLQRIDIAKLFEGLGRPDKPAKALNAEDKIPLRLRPTLGRTMNVDPNRGVDLTKGFRLLEMKCATNNVKKDAMVQRFHVRRGQRRKLDRSLKWRVAFKAGFLEECARIRRMKNQGW